MAKKKSKRHILIRKAKAATILRKRIAKKDFWAFCLYYDPKFFSKRLFLKKVAEAFMRVYESYSAGIIYRLAVSMPPRAGKSYISSLFIAWMYGHFPEESVMRNCCSDTLYNKLSYDTRDVVKSRRFKEILQTQSLADALRGQLLSGKALTGLSADVSYTVRQHTETGLYLVLQQPQPLSAGTLRLLYSVSVLCALACIILSVVLSLQLSRQVFQPIGRLHHAIRQVGKNNLDVQVPVPAGRHDELGELAQQFNTMVVALRHNQQALLENQRALNRAQIRMLQAQLNPHFLCNTLDTMKWISKINQVPQVALMSTNLADILRFCITPDEFVPLRRELEILSRYVEIQRIRLSESFSYTEAVPEALLSCMVPKMLLQPLAENAILHGLSGVEHGELSVTAVLAEQDVLEIRVRDNGCGFPPDLLGPYKPPETQTGHLGLLNVDTILRKHYGDAFGLRLENPEGGGACILARLPAKGGPGV